MSEPSTEQDAKESSASSSTGKTTKKKEIYTYHTPWTAYSLAWRRHPQGHFQFASGSFIEEYTNQFHIVHLDKTANDGDGKFNKLCQFDHPYPATKVMFAPSKFNPTGNTGNYG